ncbi:hypothetical protein C8J57DRAFT_382999 [Mycena rebaudengoi]|nr:hypothetical protein C8J57DRAFT_382999 [Mycena rebaudengoi]
MAYHVFRIQELCDHIAAYISEADLKSTALVCRTLRYSAQSHLFRDVHLARNGLPNPPYDTKAAAAACRRLSIILTTSPHLLRVIRRLTILAIPQILEPLISRNIRFPLLREAHLSFWDTRAPDESVLRWTQSIIALPSLCAIGIYSSSDVPFERFTSLFDTCSPNLCALALRGVSVTASQDSTPIPDLDMHRLLATARRIRITRLALSGNSRDVGEWLVSPWCPFDFAHLADLDIPLQSSSPVFPLLSTPRASLTRLRLSDGAYRPNDIKLSEFPALTCLETTRGTCPVVSTLSPNHSVQRFVLDIEATTISYHLVFGPSAVRSLFYSADALVAESQLPQVTLRVNNAAPDFDLDLIRASFPLLQEKFKDLLQVVVTGRTYDQY